MFLLSDPAEQSTPLRDLSPPSSLSLFKDEILILQLSVKPPVNVTKSVASFYQFS
jgi:hypothetical protein